MSNETSSKITAVALLIEGTNSQIHAINRHKDNWDAKFQLDDQTIELFNWEIKKIDSTHSALHFPLGKLDKFENLATMSKNLTFDTASRMADEVLSPLVNNGMKVKLMISDKEFTLKKSSIKFFNKKLTGAKN
jgi:hypothetical protein